MGAGGAPPNRVVTACKPSRAGAVSGDDQELLPANTPPEARRRARLPCLGARRRSGGYPCRTHSDACWQASIPAPGQARETATEKRPARPVSWICRSICISSRKRDGGHVKARLPRIWTPLWAQWTIGKVGSLRGLERKRDSNPLHQPWQGCDVNYSQNLKTMPIPRRALCSKMSTKLPT
jgi:hypothetical protein